MKYPYRFAILVLSSFFLFSCQHIKKSCDSWKKASHHSECCKKAKAEGKSCRKGYCPSKNSLAGVAMIKDVNGNKIQGTVSFSAPKRGEKSSMDDSTQAKSKKSKKACSKSKGWKVQVKAEVKGLEPNKKFGFHVHEFGTCENKGLMAGGHFNPWQSKHGASKDKERHLGDLGNLESNDKGLALYEESVKGSLKMFMGRSVIIHEKADDLKSQPSGKSGQRIACGIIGAGPAPVSAEQEAPAEKAEVEKTQGQKAKVQKASSKQETKVQKASSKQETAVQKASAKQKAEVQKASSKQETKVQKASSKQETAVQKASAKQETKVQKASAKQKANIQKASAKQETAVQKASTKQETKVQKASTKTKGQ